VEQGGFEWQFLKLSGLRNGLECGKRRRREKNAIHIRLKHSGTKEVENSIPKYQMAQLWRRENGEV
jgi:hypothetical protein